MTTERSLELSWFECIGHSCLRVRGWATAEFSELSGLDSTKLGRRLAVLPSELVEAGVKFGATQPLAGRFEIDKDSVCFVPRFPFLDGLGYSLLVAYVFEKVPGNESEVWTIQRPALERRPTTGVVAIYPSTDQMPVNQLKVYVHFSSPMSEGWAARAVSVRRADNDSPLEGVFLTTEPELWDRERRRLTLLLDPGRIKRGLAPNAEVGYPLIEGVPMIVNIDTEFRDATGQPLRTGVGQRYEIGPPVRSRVKPADWWYQCPTVGSTDPLTVEFDRPLDHALLEHSLWVHDAAGMVLDGRGSVDAGEASWRFEPQAPWQEGRHMVIVDHRLEDLAGNSLTRVFDRDLTRAEDEPACIRHAEIDFTCAPALHAAPHKTYEPKR